MSSTFDQNFPNVTSKACKLKEDVNSITDQYLLNVLEEFLQSNDQDVSIQVALELAKRLNSDDLVDYLLDAQIVSEYDLN